MSIAENIPRAYALRRRTAEKPRTQWREYASVAHEKKCVAKMQEQQIA